MGSRLRCSLGRSSSSGLGWERSVSSYCCSPWSTQCCRRQTRWFRLSSSPSLWRSLLRFVVKKIWSCSSGPLWSFSKRDLYRNTFPKECSSRSLFQLRWWFLMSLMVLQVLQAGSSLKIVIILIYYEYLEKSNFCKGNWSSLPYVARIHKFKWSLWK